VLFLRRWATWSKPLTIVKPATVARSHRAALRRHWAGRSRLNGGRPAIDPQGLSHSAVLLACRSRKPDPEQLPQPAEDGVPLQRRNWLTRVARRSSVSGGVLDAGRSPPRRRPRRQARIRENPLGARLAPVAPGPSPSGTASDSRAAVPRLPPGPSPKSGSESDSRSAASKACGPPAPSPSTTAVSQPEAASDARQHEADLARGRRRHKPAESGIWNDPAADARSSRHSRSPWYCGPGAGGAVCL